MSENKWSARGLKILKIFSWIVVSVIGLLILIVLAVQIPWVQNKIKDKAISFVEEKIGTPVGLDYIMLSFPKKLVLKGLYFQDQQGDTLLYARRLGVDTDLWSLTNNTIEVNRLELDGFTSFISRSAGDSAFNFDYIINAFVTDDTVAVDTSAVPWSFKLGDIRLTDLHLALNDSLSGNHLETTIGKVSVDIETFNLEESSVNLADVLIADVQAAVMQTKIPEAVPDTLEVVPEDSSAVAFNIGFNKLNVLNIGLTYQHSGLGQLAELTLQEAFVEANNIDLRNQSIDLERIVLRNSFVVYQQMAVEKRIDPVDPEAAAHDEQQGGWNFSLAALDVSGTSFRYDNYFEPQQPLGLDFNHLGVNGFSTRLRNVRFQGEEAFAVIAGLSFREKSGFGIRSFKSTVALKKDSFALKNFALQTLNSSLALDASARFSSLEELSSNPEHALLSLLVRSSSVSIKDVLLLNPGVLGGLPVTLSPSAVVSFNAAMKGSLGDLFIERLQVHTLENTSLFANGRVRNVMSPENLALDINLDRFYTTRQDIRSILQDSLIPPSVQVPQWLNLEGNIAGTLIHPRVQAKLTSDMGAVSLTGEIDMAEKTKETYAGELRILDFNTGALIRQQDMGRLDMVAAVKGTGLSVENLDASIKARVNRFVYGGYTYRDFRLDGKMKKFFFTGEASMRDENLDFTLAGDLDYTNDVPEYELDLDLRNADFKKLKLTPRPLKAKGSFEVNLATADFQRINGNFGIRNFGVYNGESLYTVDSLLFASIDQVGQSEISVRSDILSGDFKGTINLFSLGDALGRHFNRYFSLHDTAYSKPLENQNFRFKLLLKNTELITEVLLPDLDPFKPGEITGEFNSARQELNMRFSVAEIRYSGVSLDSITFSVRSDRESLDFDFGLTNIVMDTMKVSAVRMAGYVMNDSIHTNLMILDSLDQEKYYLGGMINSVDDVLQFSLVKNHLVLNYQKWDTPLYNTLRFAENGLDPNNFYISKGNERILLLRKANRDSTLSLAFREVDLRNITSLIEGTTPVSGLIDGEVTLAAAEEGQFATDLRINELGIFGAVWGDLSLLMTKERQGPTNFKLGLDGPATEMKATGVIGNGEDAEITVDALMPKLDLAVLEPLAMGQVRDLKGRLSADLEVRGKMSDPSLSGRVNFSNTSFVSDFTNSVFKLEDESIYLRDEDFVFDRFEVLDARNNRATLSGLVSGREEGGYDLKLNLNATDFNLLNSTEEDSDLIYGNIRVNTESTITGTSALPVIRMNISLAEESELTFVVPQTERAILEQKGIVVFVDKDAMNDPFMASIDPSDTVEARFTGIDLTANIELSGGEVFNVVIDPATGDKLSVRGNSTLTMHMDPTGDMSLSGRYEIEEGTYDLSFAKFIKRNFSIAEGSTITWSGDPMAGEMDIRAIYEVETSPIELVANQVEEEELSMYRKESPFHVELILKGELLFPEISFQLDMPEEDRDEYGGNVYAKLRDINTRESDLNKQVFALMILKRFISDNPFESQGGGDLAGSARKSVSKILSDQLNRLSSNVKGVELSFDLKSYDDYAGGSAQAQTELQLGVSKSLLNDRLVVKVSGNVDIEGETSQQNSFTDFIGDLALEYKLTEDGRFRITGFRNSNYDLINGDLIETGAGLIYIKDYDSLVELFKANEEKGASGKTRIR